MGVLSNFAFVLVRPLEAGNVGAAARALKNMGFDDLRLVAPRVRANGRAATAMAVHAGDVLQRASSHDSLADALTDRTLTVGTTCRTGVYRSGVVTLRAAASQLVLQASVNRIALIFGPEDTGLTNHELKLCQRLVTIPTAPEYRSINLAQAVMLTAYELMMAAGAERAMPPVEAYAPVAAVDAMLERMSEALISIGFLPAENPEHIMFALRAILGRASLNSRELDIMSGIARQIRWFSDGGFETTAAKLRNGKKLR